MKNSCLLFLSFVLSANIIGQGINYNKEFVVNTYTENYQSVPSVCNLTNGGFIVSWQSLAQVPVGYSIFAQIFDEFGQAFGDEFQVSTDSNYAQTKSVIANLNNGDFVICWESRNQDGSGFGIYAQMFDEYGEKVRDEFKVNTTTEDWQMDPSITGLNGGGFVVCWESREENNGSSYGIFAQMYDNEGNKVGTEFKVNTIPADNLLNPFICDLITGGFIICWEDGDLFSQSYGEVKAQIYNQTGTPVGSEFQINTYTENRQGNASICRLMDGRLIVCWDSWKQDSSSGGIYAQMLDSNGVKIGDEFQVHTYTYGRQENPVVSSISTGGFFISWLSDQDGSWEGVYAQLFDIDLNKVGNEFRVNDYTYQKQFNQSMIGLPNGNLFICWESFDQDGDLFGIIAKNYLSDPINHNLISYELLQPELNANLDHANPKFTWNHASNVHINFPWELTYDLYIDTDISFSNSIVQLGIQDSTFQIDSLANGQTYYWKVLAKNYYGDSLWSSTINDFTIDTAAVVGVKIIDPEIPESFNLFQNYPNPFNPTTKIKFTIPTSPLNPSPYQGEGNRERFITLKVYDILGNEVTTLVNEQKSPGTYEVEFSASGRQGLSSGIYFYKLNAGSFSQTKKMLLMK